MERLELEDIQGIVAYSYVNRPHACYVMLQIDGACVEAARRRLHDMQTFVARVRQQREAGQPRPIIAMAFSHAGLAKLGLSPQCLSEFVPEFRESMVGEHRSRVLGDIDHNDPARWRWGKPADSVDVLVAVYGEHEQELRKWVDAQVAEAAGALVANYRVYAAFRPHENNRRDLREPFGFRDGISQPFVEGFGRPAPVADAPSNAVRAGEFVLGYPNQIGRTSLSPTMPAGEDPRDRLSTLPGGRRDFGRNGTYLVARQLEQDVESFREIPAEIQAKLIGRWPSGAPLTLTPARDERSFGGRNDFGFVANDRAGLRCPIGAHIRRANPRDGFADSELPQTAEESLEAVNLHRLLRRGRPYREEGKQGTFFICLNTNIERQFEFVQQSWLNSPSFMNLNGDRDFAAGRPTTFTIPYCAGRQKIRLEKPLVTVRGGGYFFLPGVNALEWLLTR
jgi:Dyp-type peroxidase family